MEVSNHHRAEMKNQLRKGESEAVPKQKGRTKRARAANEIGLLVFVHVYDKKRGRAQGIVSPEDGLVFVIVAIRE